MSKTQNDLKNVKLPTQAVKRIKELCASKSAYIQDWLLTAAAAAYLAETGESLIEADEHENNAI